MDQITFHRDTVLSDVHLLVPNTRHLMTRLNRVGQPVFISKFRILSEGERLNSNESEKGVQEATEGGATREGGGDRGEGNVEPLLDEDGDIDITRRPRKPSDSSDRDPVFPIILQQSDSVLEAERQSDDDDDDDDEKCLINNVIRIEHTMATPLEDVGKQVWRGAFLLADFILSEPLTFRGATVLELGAGTGLTSIVMATTAKTVYCTDVGEDLLSMCKRNAASNIHLLEPSGGQVKVRHLDWLQDDLCTDSEVEFSWTDEEVADMYDHTSFIIAADICYDDDLTDGLFRTLYRLCSHFAHGCTVFIAIEKRMNFTLRHLNVSCEAYDHFTQCLSQLQDLEDGRCSFSVEQLPSGFAQSLLYERIEQLELWKVTVARPGSDPVPPSGPGLPELQVTAGGTAPQ